MTDFEPFANESQVLTLVSGDDEMSLENGTVAVVLSGTLTLTQGDKESRANALALQVVLSRIVDSL